MLVYHPDIAASLAADRGRELERTAARYRLARLARRDRTPHDTPSIRPAPLPLRTAGSTSLAGAPEAPVLTGPADVPCKVA